MYFQMLHSLYRGEKRNKFGEALEKDLLSICLVTLHFLFLKSEISI